MGKLFDSAKKHSHAKASFKIGDVEHKLLVKLFNVEDYNKQIEVFNHGDNQKAAETMAGYFLDPDTLEPIVTAEELLSNDWKNADTTRLFNLFMDVNNGAEGN